MLYVQIVVWRPVVTHGPLLDGYVVCLKVQLSISSANHQRN